MAAGANRRWGFHQLTDHWARQLVAASGVGPGDLVLDVGAGTGTLTAPLARTGARVIAIELHPGRFETLRRRFDVDSMPGVRTVQADAGDLRLPGRPFHVVANPQWSMTTPLLKRLLSPGSRLIRADLVLEAAAARRWAAGNAPGANRWGRHFEVGVAVLVPRRAFRPHAPRVAAVLTVSRR